jgi:cobalt transporter subunit CbtA
MITRVLAVGLLAGLLAGLTVSVLQAYTTTPIILEAETFEKGAESATSSGPAAALGGFGEARLFLVHGGEEHAHGGDAAGEEWSPGDGLERTLYTSTATIATSIGFALILIAGMLTAGGRIDERQGLAWAGAGFIATGLAPAMGLAPELPGMPAGDLAARQVWWLFTCAATAGALWLFLRTENMALRILAVPLLLAPHIWGAPHLISETASSVPATLAARFAATSLAVQAILWTLTGVFVGLLWNRIGAGATLEAADAR